MTLSKFSILLGCFMAIAQAPALMKPAQTAAAMRKFPRSEMWGYVLMAIGSAWFLYNLNREAIAEFAAYKKLMLIGFGSVAVLSCLFVPDYLAVRGMCITALMLSWYTMGLTRWATSDWRLVLVVWAYLVVIMSMWFMVSPWRMRDLMNWVTADPGRMRNVAIVRIVFGAFLVVLGATAFRGE